MPAGGHIAATRIDCPCGESFMKDGNNPIKCPKEKRILEFEGMVREFVETSERAYNFGIKPDNHWSQHKTVARFIKKFKESLNYTQNNQTVER